MNRLLIALIVLLVFPSCPANVKAVEPAPLTPEVQPSAESAQLPNLAPIGEDIQDWQARWELARLLSYTKRYEESLAQYRRLLQEKPDLPKALLEMAAVWSWSGKTSEAVALLRNVPQQKMDNEMRAAMADIFIAAKDYPAAEALLTEYLQLSPNDDIMRLKLAELLSWAKRYSASLEAYELILKHRPNDTQVRRKYAYVLLWAGKRDQATEELRKSLNK